MDGIIQSKSWIEFAGFFFFFLMDSGSSEQQAISRTTSWVLAIFFFSLLGIGMGRTAVETLGVPYIDDNVANRESATYIGTTSSSIPLCSMS